VGTGVVVRNLQHHLRSHPGWASIPTFEPPTFAARHSLFFFDTSVTHPIFTGHG
jgi:hypothetical protein